MDIKELRIGNLVCDDRGVETEIHALSRNEINNDDLTPQYSGIPITEEWLLKFGFVAEYTKEEEPEIIGYQRWWTKNHYRWDIMIDIEQFGVIILNTSYDEKLFCMYTPCDYVHQLQNLYFALTGKELTIQ